MFSNAFIDIAVALALMYFILSLFCTIFNEFISTFLKLRARSLKAGIEQLLDDPALRTQFYNHGLIKGTRGNSAGGQPSDNDHPSYISSETFVLALLASLDPTKPVPVFTDFENSIRNLPNSNVKDAMLSQVLIADSSLTNLREGLAIWFDQSMDRLSGAYKRKLKLISCVVGFILALLVNADTLMVSKTLWHDADMRASIMQVAGNALIMESKPNNNSTSDSIAQSVMLTAIQAEQNLRPFPLGWSFNQKYLHQLDFPNFLIFGFFKLFGILLTTAALTLGAPFWFDLLSKIMHIRGTGEKPERTSKSTPQ